MRLLYGILICFLSTGNFVIAQESDSAQEEQKLIEHVDHAVSGERIRSVSIYYEENIHTRSVRTPEKLNAMLAACYRIAERDGDSQFKDYLSFYKKTNAIMFFPESDMLVREGKTLKVWEGMLKYYQAVGDERFIAICNINAGYSLFMLKDFSKSIEQLLIADEQFQKIGYSKFPEMTKYLHNMALIFYFFRQYEKVAELMEISAQLPPYDNNRHIQLYNTLGSAYTNLKRYDKAEEAFIKTKETAVKYNDLFWIAYASRALAKVYLERGKYKEALDLYEAHLGYIEQYKETNKMDYSGHLLGLAKANIFLNRLTIAGQYLERINYHKVSGKYDSLFMFGINFRDINYWLNFYEVQRSYYTALKNYKKAFYYSDSLYSIKYKVDSLFNGLEVKVAQNRIEAQEKQYQNDKKEATIQSKNKQMLLIGSLLAVIAIASVILFRQNRKINSRNKIIDRQLFELSKILDQKQILLSELQHRVKNNLQHVISILEIQKESVSFNNIDELIRGNQNRIYSMALLHKKLNVSDAVNEVVLGNYITELANLVKDSYEDHKKKIHIDITCQMTTISVETALPLGLIVVELVSNSIKHAFKRVAGTIVIDITGDRLRYADNGRGFNFNTTPKRGLGIEIIKGLIDQLGGTVETRTSNGFELIVHFK